MPAGKRERRYHLAGWILFILCAALFLYSALRDGDGVLVLASGLFLVACLLFLLPLLFPYELTEKREKDDGPDR